MAIDRQLEAREVARVLEKQALGRGAGGLDVTELVEHGKNVTIFQHPPATGRRLTSRPLPPGMARKRIEGGGP